VHLLVFILYSFSWTYLEIDIFCNTPYVTRLAIVCIISQVAHMVAF